MGFKVHHIPSLVMVIHRSCKTTFPSTLCTNFTTSTLADVYLDRWSTACSTALVNGILWCHVLLFYVYCKKKSKILSTDLESRIVRHRNIKENVCLDLGSTTASSTAVNWMPCCSFSSVCVFFSVVYQFCYVRYKRNLKILKSCANLEKSYLNLR